MTGEIVFLSGFMNITDPLFHFQLYIWSWVLGAIFIVVIHLGFRYGPWEGYKAFWGLYDAYKAESNAAFTSGLQLYFLLRSEAQAKIPFDYSKWDYEIPGGKLRRLLFFYPTAFLDNIDPAHAFLYKFGHRNMDVEIAKKLQNYEWEESPSTTIGGTRTDIILDADLWCPRDTPQHQAVEECCQTWNVQNPQDQIHSYSKFQRYLNENKIQPPPGVKKEVVVPWTRIDASFPVAMEDNETSGFRRWLAEELSAAEKNPLMKHTIMILIGGFAFSGGIYLLRFLSWWVSRG